MLVIPAIDLRGGRCVRLYQGDFDRETAYSDDPVEVALQWIQAGAPRLHVVDLDGARAGRPAQLGLVGRICAHGVPVQLGGGLRTIDDVRAALEVGVDRVILGTAAIENPSLIPEAIGESGSSHVVLGIDARGGFVAVRGWEEISSIQATDIIATAHESGVERVVYTDIDRDGTLAQPNYEETARVAGIGPAVIASGGVSKLDDLRRLATISNVEAAIVGRALYDGTITVDANFEWILDPGVTKAGGADEQPR